MHNITVNVTEALNNTEREKQQSVEQPLAPLAAKIGSPSSIDDVHNMQEAVEYHARRGWIAWEPEPLK